MGPFTSVSNTYEIAPDVHLVSIKFFRLIDNKLQLHYVDKLWDNRYLASFHDKLSKGDHLTLQN